MKPDDVGVLLSLSGEHGSWTWQRMVGEGPVSGDSGWCDLPWYITYRLTQSLWAMRVDVAVWSAVLSAYAVLLASRFFGVSGAALTAAVLTFTPWSLGSPAIRLVPRFSSKNCISWQRSRSCV